LFALESVPTWQPVLDGHYPPQGPASLALYPAQALLYRRGLVKETEPVVVVNANPEDMFQLRGTAFTDPSAGDANRSNEGGRDTSKGGVELWRFATGKVRLDFTEEKSGTVLAAKNATREIDWQHERGLFLVRAPQTQGVTGFLKDAGRIEFDDLTINAGMPFGVVWAVAMDNQPLSRSGKILLEVMSEERNSGFTTEGAPQRKILDLGHTPIIVRQLSGEVRFKRADAGKLRVTALDVNGCPKGSASTADRIVLQPDTIYYLIER
jgi:hypothetical protein